MIFGFSSITSRAKAIFSATVLLGNKRKSWNTTPSFLRNLGILLRFIRVTSKSSTMTVPASGTTSCVNNLNKVDFPAPL